MCLGHGQEERGCHKRLQLLAWREHGLMVGEGYARGDGCHDCEGSAATRRWVPQGRGSAMEKKGICSGGDGQGAAVRVRLELLGLGRGLRERKSWD